MTPDFVLKGAFNGKLLDRTAHLDIGTVFRVFRNYAPSSGGGFSDKSYAGGFGINADFSLEVLKNTRLVLNGFYGYGAGRYVGGLVPDVIVKANGNIQQIPAYSWVSGFEIAPNKATGFYVYYSGVYGQKETTVDTSGGFIGWGYPGASNAADRIVSEITAGYSRVLWKHENLGSVQTGFQYAYLWLQPWSTGGGPNQAQTNMFFSQLRYNLPYMHFPGALPGSCFFLFFWALPGHKRSEQEIPVKADLYIVSLRRTLQLLRIIGSTILHRAGRAALNAPTPQHFAFNL